MACSCAIEIAFLILITATMPAQPLCLISPGSSWDPIPQAQAGLRPHRVHNPVFDSPWPGTSICLSGAFRRR